MPPMPPLMSRPPRLPPAPLPTVQAQLGGPRGQRPLPFPLNFLDSLGFMKGPPTPLVPSGNTGEKILATGGLAALTIAIPPTLPLTIYLGYNVWDPEAQDKPGVVGGMAGLAAGNALDPGRLLDFVLLDP